MRERVEQLSSRLGIFAESLPGDLVDAEDDFLRSDGGERTVP